MADSTGDFLIKRLHEWGVRRIYGFPGDGINGVLGALDRHSDLIEFIQTRHEEDAAFMACAHAKFSNEIGVCLATSGPGAIHLLNGLYDARMDHQPVLAIVGQQATTAMGGEYQQEVDLISLFKDVASHYVHQMTVPSQLRQLVDRSIRIALAERTVTCIILPNDLQDSPMEPPKYKHGNVFTGSGYSYPQIIPAQADLQAAADVLNAGERVAILVGAGALNAASEVMQVADVLGAGVAKALLGKAVLPDDLPYVTGSIGLLGTNASWEMMSQCDTLLMIGSGFPYSEFLPKEGQARGVQIDIKPRMLSLRYPMEVPLHGDSAETLRALLPLLKRRTDLAWRETIQGHVADSWKLAESRAYTGAVPINPQLVCWELSPLLPDKAIITCDSGASASWYARDLKMRAGMMGSLSGLLATMCPGVPYATAAKFVHPDRVAVALVGDGAMQMLGINGLITIAKYWQRWTDPRLVVIVFDNLDLNMVSWEQRVMEGNRKFAESQDVPQFPYARYAEGLGLLGIEVRTPDMLRPALETALKADRPCVLDVHTDPNVPPLPPHITFEQAKHYLYALMKGDPDTSGIITQSVKQMLAKYFPHHHKD